MQKLTMITTCDLPDEKGEDEKTPTRSNDFQTRLNKFEMHFNTF